jgi:hypothetical protein
VSTNQNSVWASRQPVCRFATNSTAYQTHNKCRMLVARELYSICNQGANLLSALRFSIRACLKTMTPSPQSAFPLPLREGSTPRLRALLLGMEAQRHTTGKCENTGAFGACSFDLKPERNNQGNFLTMARSKTS